MRGQGFDMEESGSQESQVTCNYISKQGDKGYDPIIVTKQEWSKQIVCADKRMITM